MARRRAARALAGFALWAAASTAWAHAALIETQPADGAVLASAPAKVRLRFNESVAPLRLTMVLPDGSTRALGEIETEADGLVVAVPASTLRGSFLLSWRVVSTDGHPVGGALVYSVGTTSAVRADSASDRPPGLGPAIWLSRFVLYVAVFAAVGGVLFRAFMPATEAPVRRTITLSVLAGCLALSCAVGLQGLDALAAPFPALLSMATWRASAATSYGITAALLLLSLLAALASVHSRGLRSRRVFATTALLLAGAALAASGHASAAPPRWLARPSVFVHVVAVALWVGSLYPLLRALREPQGSRVLAIFSRVAPWVVVALLASGTTLALLQLDLSQAIWATAYGRVLAAKLVIVVAILAVAAVNRYRLTGPALRGDAPALARMSVLVRVEIALAVVVLAWVATWRFTPPPRVLAVMAPRVQHVLLHRSGSSVDLAMSAERDGRVLACLSLLGAGAALADAKEVSLAWSNPTLAVEPVRREARRQGDGRWCVEPFALPAASRWHVIVETVVSDFEQRRFEGDVDMPSPP